MGQNPEIIKCPACNQNCCRDPEDFCTSFVLKGGDWPGKIITEDNKRKLQHETNEYYGKWQKKFKKSATYKRDHDAFKRKEEQEQQKRNDLKKLMGNE
jgi:hypothetical protein